MAVSSITTLTPVIFSEGAGPLGADEFFAPAFPEVATHTLTVGWLLPRVHLVGAWYTLFDAVSEVTAFRLIDVQPGDGMSVRLAVSAQPGASARLRLRVYVLVQEPDPA